MDLDIVSNFEIGISDLNHNLFRVSIFEIRISFFAVLASWRDKLF